MIVWYNSFGTAIIRKKFMLCNAAERTVPKIIYLCGCPTGDGMEINMYKLCKTEESVRRQKEIEEKLLSAMLTKRYEDITVVGLCEEMNIPRKAFYRYFDSKDDCLKALIDHTLFSYWEFSDVYNGAKKKELFSELEKFFLFWIENKRLLDALSVSDMLGALVENSASSMYESVNFRKFLPEEEDRMRERIFQFTVCGLMFSMIDWYRGGFKYSTCEMAEAAVRMLSKPLFPNLENITIY